MLHLPGRHFCPCADSCRHINELGLYSGKSDQIRHDGQLEEEYLGPHPTVGASGVYVGFKARLIDGTSRKAENMPQGVGQVGDSSESQLLKDGSHFGASPQFSHRHAFSEGFYKQDAKFCATK